MNLRSVAIQPHKAAGTRRAPAKNMAEPNRHNCGTLWPTSSGLTFSCYEHDSADGARISEIDMNLSTMKKEGFSYEYHYRTKDRLALADFKINACE
jgi:hypothetical protein